MAISPTELVEHPLDFKKESDAWETVIDDWFKTQTQYYDSYVMSSYKSMSALAAAEIKKRYLDAGWKDVKISWGSSRDPAIVITFFRKER
jgi:hypothetical protein